MINLVYGPKDGFLFDPDTLVANRKQQGGGRVMMRSGIVDQTIIGPIKIDERVKFC